MRQDRGEWSQQKSHVMWGPGTEKELQGEKETEDHVDFS